MTKPVIINRVTQGSALTYAQLDTNFSNLQNATIGVTDGTNTHQFSLNDTITFASSGNVGIGVNSSTGAITVSGSFVTSVSGTSGRITSTGGLTPVLDLATTAVSAGSYTLASITVDAYGRITTASSGTPYTLPTASTSVLGGVKVDGSTITINNGVISSSGGSGFSKSGFTITGTGYTMLRDQTELILQASTGAGADSGSYIDMLATGQIVISPNSGSNINLSGVVSSGSSIQANLPVIFNNNYYSTTNRDSWFTTNGANSGLKGSMLWNTTVNAFQYYDGSAWQTFVGTGGALLPLVARSSNPTQSVSTSTYSPNVNYTYQVLDISVNCQIELGNFTRFVPYYVYIRNASGRTITWVDTTAGTTTGTLLTSSQSLGYLFMFLRGHQVTGGDSSTNIVKMN